MNLIQRAILCMGCNTLAWIWIHPPVYRVANNIRLEHNLYYVWQVPVDWSVNLPMVALRMATVVLITTGLCLAFAAAKKKEAA